MGTIYYVGCRDCNVKRNLGKFYSLLDSWDVVSRKDVFDFAALFRDPDDSWRGALLISFIGTHMYHAITLFREQDEGFDDMPEETVNFWKPAPEETGAA